MPTLEADVALIHIAGGDARVSPPPGTLAQTPPRRPARGRGDDMLFLTVDLSGTTPGSQNILEPLVRQASQTYYGTPGTVTAALREAAGEVNRRLLDLNQQEGVASHREGRLMAAVLRNEDFFVAQCGEGQAILVRGGRITRFTADESGARPLGIAVAANVRFHHTQVQVGDLVLLTTFPPPLWSDPTLSGLSDLSPAEAVERLVAASGQDLTGILIRVVTPSVGPGRLPTEAPAPVASAPSRGRQPAAAPADRRRLRRPPSAAERTARRVLRALLLPFQRLRGGVGQVVPALAPSMPQGTFSPTLLAATAIAVPLVVVALVTVVYLRRGRSEQYTQFLSQAQTAVVAAQLKPSLEEARPDWEAAAQWLDQASRYGDTTEIGALREEVQKALDELDHLDRMEFASAVDGGFGPRARIRAVAATANDIYTYDDSVPEIYHAWFTGRAYEIDRDFQCLQALPPEARPDRIVDVLVQHEPGALGPEGIVAIDGTGGLVYCAPGANPASGRLTPPDTGWGELRAVDLSGDNLFVLDPKANQVWIYTAADGLFAGTPALYFTEVIQSLNHAVDLAATEDQLILLYDDGLVDACRRPQEKAPDGSLRIRVECDRNIDLKPGDTTLTSIVYSPPPEPSLYFLDPKKGTVFQYSLRLVYQGRFIPTPPLKQDVTDLAVGPPHDLFLAAGDQVYFAQPTP
jgi:hypothetical protein